MLHAMSMITASIIAGIRDRYLLAAALVLVIFLVVMLLLRRRRRGSGLDVNPLQQADAQRYMAEFANVEREFIDHPAQAVARARGIVEEVMRRMGFPDRIDATHKAKDLSGYDRESGKLLTEAETGLRDHGDDTERLRLVLQRYRSVMQRLLGEEAAAV